MKCSPTHSIRAATQGIMSSPILDLGDADAQEPTRIKVSAPQPWSSSTVIAMDGPPIPVDVTATRSPSSVPTYVRNSRLWHSSCGSSKYSEISRARYTLPGIKT